MNFGGKDGVSTDASVIKDDGTHGSITSRKTIRTTSLVRKSMHKNPLVSKQISESSSVVNNHNNAQKRSSEIQKSKALLVHHKINHTTQLSGILANGLCSPNNSKVCVRGNTVSMVSGEVLLEYEDFQFPGPLPLIWSRTYRSSNNVDSGLGVGWSALWFSHLEIKEGY